MTWFFLFFFVSGFCGILYEIVWLRLAMAQFGVTTALVSIVLSMFMAGLGVGSWASGWLTRKYRDRAINVWLKLYAATELLIGCSALIVPFQLQWGRLLLEKTGVPSSGVYYVGSGIWIALALVPWCACMGATIPLGMAAIRNTHQKESSTCFSYLYLANVIGATAGAVIPLFLIELYGFHRTLQIGAACNAVLGVSAFLLSKHLQSAQQPGPQGNVFVADRPRELQDWKPLVLLFCTGLTSMGTEVIWIRQFTPYLGTMVYAFAAILAIYLLSTACGSKIYRAWHKKHEQPAIIWLGLGLCTLLSLAAADPNFRLPTFLRPIVGIGPFSMVLGFITPMLVDRWSEGDPDRAGTAYAFNVAGCILGPLLAGFLLLPFVGEHWAICIFAIPWLAAGMNPRWLIPGSLTLWRKPVAYVLLLLAIQLTWVTKDFEAQFAHGIVLRDSTATIVADTSSDGSKRLLVNGVGITSLSPITKIMAHLPMASLDRPPQNALNICFGMGTTFRSLMSWGVPTTSVELVPSVPRVFSYFHPDGAQVLRSPLAHVVVDDGRRYLERTWEQFDVITIDPPPPIEAAGSGMLYSKEFYRTLTQRLRKNGILQQWLPEGDPVVRSSVARALAESFSHVRVFQYFPTWGYQFLASNGPIPYRTGPELVKHMPDAAIRDLMEWPFEKTPEQELGFVLQKEKPLSEIIAADPNAQAMRDDHPVNEYVLLRELNASRFHSDTLVAWYEHTKSP
ncbi:MAG TPA: MFS transporter [Terriglobales bacterium]